MNEQADDEPMIPRESFEVSATFNVNDPALYDALLVGAQPEFVGEVIGGRWDGASVVYRPPTPTMRARKAADG